VTAAVRAVVAPLAGTFLVSNGERVLVRSGNPVVPVVPTTEYVVVIVSLDCVVRPQE
jgi:hypothetical protein